MAHLLTCSDIAKSFGVQPLFSGISFSIHEGERIGLIGPNGAGKSTLLKILAGVEAPDSGTLTSRKGIRVAYVPQSEEFEAGKTVEEILLAHAGPLSEEAHARVGEVRSIVGFSGGNPLVETLSGGWRKRLAIATRLLVQPDLLLLDEPTNHLDLGGIEWLERFIENAPFAVVVISHDRLFLEHSSSRIIEISRRYPQGFFACDGNYSRFLEKRAEMLTQLDKQEQSLANRVRREIEWLRRGPKARTTKATARIEQAEALTAELSAARARSRQTGTAEVDFTGTGRQTKELIKCEEVSKAFGTREVVKDLTFVVTRGLKLGIVGANGSGKSTVLKLLSGELEPDAGTIRRAPNLKIVTFDQQRQAMKSAVSLRRFLAPDADSVVFQGNLLHVASYARRFLFQPQQLDTPVMSLSGGEQARLLIARLMLQAADVLLLDEPTNDLDIDTLEVLEENLVDFPGSVVIITYDRMMSESVCEQFYSLEARLFFATHEQAVRAVRKKLQDAPDKAERSGEKSNTKPGAPGVTDSPSPQPKPSPAKPSQKERRELENLERKIEAAEAELKAMEAAVSTAAPGKPLQEACEKLGETKAKLDALLERWTALAEKAS